MKISSGSTTNVIFFEAVNVNDETTPETGLSTFTVYYSRNGGALTAYTTPTVVEVAWAEAPGIYRLTVDEGTTLDSGFDTQELLLVIIHPRMRTLRGTVELFRPKATIGNTLAVSAGGVAQSDMAALSGSTDAANNLEAGALALVLGVCAAGSSTSVVNTTLTEATTNHYSGRVITFTSGTLLGQSAGIVSYNGTTKALTVSGLTEAPALNDSFVIS